MSCLFPFLVQKNLLMKFLNSRLCDLMIVSNVVHGYVTPRTWSFMIFCQSSDLTIVQSLHCSRADGDLEVRKCMDIPSNKWFANLFSNYNLIGFLMLFTQQFELPRSTITHGAMFLCQQISLFNLEAYISSQFRGFKYFLK